LSSGGESSSDEAENETGEDIGILDETWDYEAWDYEDGLMGENSEDDLGQTLKDPQRNANMEEEEIDASDDDELDKTENEENASQDAL
jgi:hypothetical protein